MSHPDAHRRRLIGGLPAQPLSSIGVLSITDGRRSIGVEADKQADRYGSPGGTVRR